MDWFVLLFLVPLMAANAAYLMWAAVSNGRETRNEEVLSAN
jgi:hypothetical protein